MTEEIFQQLLQQLRISEDNGDIVIRVNKEEAMKLMPMLMGMMFQGIADEKTLELLAGINKEN